MNEIWKDIIGYEGLYQVSNLGRVKRNDRIHKSYKNNLGYERFELSKKSKQRIFSGHRIVAIAFIPNPNNFPNVCHKDDDKSNNKVDNLFWGTQKDNMVDKCSKNRQAKGDKNANTILTEVQVIEIRKKYIPNIYSLPKLSREYGVSIANIHHIIKRKNWKHL